MATGVALIGVITVASVDAFIGVTIISDVSKLSTDLWGEREFLRGGRYLGMRDPRATIDMVRCNRGWCEAAYAGQTGHVYTPLIMSDEPLAPVPPAPAPVVAAY